MNQKSLKHLKAAREYQAIGNSSKAQKHELRANQLQFGGFFPNTTEIERKLEQYVQTVQTLSDKIDSLMGSGSHTTEKHIAIANGLNKKNYDLQMEIQRLKQENTELTRQKNELNPNKDAAYIALKKEFEELQVSKEKLGERYEKFNQKLTDLRTSLDQMNSILRR